MPEAVITCDNLVKIYKTAEMEVVALQGLDLAVAPGEMLALVGASGAGKSTLARILSGQDTPSAGRCVVDGNDLARLNEEQRLAYRRHVAGYLWEQSGRNLLGELTVAANIELPQLLAGVRSSKRGRQVAALLELVELKGYARERVDRLTPGEQQRVALAVALANQPILLLADEPTGGLDSVAAGEIAQLLRLLNRELDLTIVIMTHDLALTAVVDRALAMRDGRAGVENIRREETLRAVSGRASRTTRSGTVSATSTRLEVPVDRAGHVRLPPIALEAVNCPGRVEIRIFEDHVELWSSDKP